MPQNAEFDIVGGRESLAGGVDAAGEKQPADSAAKNSNHFACTKRFSGSAQADGRNRHFPRTRSRQKGMGTSCCGDRDRCFGRVDRVQELSDGRAVGIMVRRHDGRVGAWAVRLEESRAVARQRGYRASAPGGSPGFPVRHGPAWPLFSPSGEVLDPVCCGLCGYPDVSRGIPERRKLLERPRGAIGLQRLEHLRILPVASKGHVAAANQQQIFFVSGEIDAFRVKNPCGRAAGIRRYSCPTRAERLSSRDAL